MLPKAVVIGRIWQNRDFPAGGIQNVPGIFLKQAEQAPGTALDGLAVKVTTGYFLIGLSSAAAVRDRNIQLLKERPWFDVPIVYGDGKRAILAFEKGLPGAHLIDAAFAAWEREGAPAASRDRT